MTCMKMRMEGKEHRLFGGFKSEGFCERKRRRRMTVMMPRVWIKVLQVVTIVKIVAS